METSLSSYGHTYTDLGNGSEWKVLKMSWRCLEDVLKTSWRCMDKTNILVLIKTSSEDVWLIRIYSSSSRRLEDVLKTSFEGEVERCLQDVFIKTNVCWEDILLKRRVWRFCVNKNYCDKDVINKINHEKEKRIICTKYFFLMVKHVTKHWRRVRTVREVCY